MSENKPSTFTDEIDLVQLLVQVVNIAKKHFKSFFVFLVVGLLLGVSGYLTFKATYTTRMVAKSRWLSNVEVQALIKMLDDLVEEENYTVLAQKLNIKDTIKLEEIKKLEVVGIWEFNEIQTPEDKRDTIFVIEARIHKTKIIPELQQGIISYLQNNDFVKKRTESYINTQKIKLAKVQEELRQLDSLQLRLEEALAQGKDMMMMAPGNIYLQSADMRDREENLKRDINFATEFQIIEPFYIPKKTTSFNLLKSAVSGLVGGGVLWFFWVIFAELRLLIINAERKNKEASKV